MLVLDLLKVKEHIDSQTTQTLLNKAEEHTVKQGGNYPIKLLLEEIPLRLSWQ